MTGPSNCSRIRATSSQFGGAPKPAQERFVDRHRCTLGTQPGGVFEIEVEAVSGHVEQPAGPGHDERRHPHGGPGIEPQWGSQAVAGLAAPIAGHLSVHCDHQSAEPGGARPGHQLRCALPPAEEIQLEPGRAVGSCDHLVHPVARHRALREDGAGAPCRLCTAAIPRRVHHPREPDRAEQERHRDLGAEHRGPKIRWGVGSDADALAQAERGDRLEVGTQCHLPAGTALQIVLDRDRDATGGQLPGSVDRVDPACDPPVVPT